MIRNFFTTIFRTVLRQKFYSAINVAGLSTGLICVIFIYLWVNDEMSKDRFHHDVEKIYRVVSNLPQNDGSILTWTIAPGPLGDDIDQNDPAAELVVRASYAQWMSIEDDGEQFLERGYFADPEFFKLFSFPLVRGAVSKNKEDVSWIAISDQLAVRIFGNPEGALGKTMTVNKKSYTVTALYEHPTSASTMQFGLIIPYEVTKKERGDYFNWNNYDHPLYVKVEPSKVAALTASINARAKKRAEAERDDEGESPTQFYLQPFQDAYLYSNFENGVPVGGRIEYVRIFTVVGLFMLIIACINFTNMATARAAARAKEVGIRKVIGAVRRSIIIQFMFESIIMSLISALLAVIVVYMLLPGFNLLVSKAIVLDFTSGRLVVSLLAIVVVTGLLAGSYPAFFLSSYQPAQVLKGTMSRQFSGASLRKLLVVFQFSLTVILIASSIVIYSQIEYIRNKNVGYERESIVRFYTAGTIFQQFDAFRNELLQIPGIAQVTKGNESLVQVNNQNSSVEWPGKDPNVDPFFRTVVVDFGYLETLGMKLKEGRFFTRENNDTARYILTQRSVEIMGLTNPIGTKISQWGFNGEVIGVVDDFHSRSLHDPIDPVVFLCKPEWTGLIFVKLSGDKNADALAAMEIVYKKFAAGYPFSYSFLEDDFEKLYNTEKVSGVLALGFTAMAIIISALGLLGLAAYTAETRKKEISIRKTLGASVSGIVTMISTDFVRLSLIAAIIGCPLSWYLMREFLSGYAYHTELDWKIFAITAISITVICVLTVVYQVVRAALANPVDALRNE